ncbi:MAG TPA: BA14K family protein [Aestuariivirgaceae bacterium]|nr:BA14K family protein [Aestuariivirgaceae bacterium]
MNRIKALSLGAAALFAGAVFATSAGAVTLSASPGISVGTPGVELVKQKKWYYNQNKHGKRFRHRDRHHRFEFDGFWYSSPFWLGGPYAYNNSYYDDYPYDYDDGYALYSDYGDDHVQACFARYRSYDPGSDTYMGYDGLRHRCRVGY